MVPNRLSYKEMYYDEFKYPTEFTESFESYKQFKHFLIEDIVNHMENYESKIALVRKQEKDLYERFFSATALYSNLGR